MNIKLTQLEAFVWVADLGSFRKAATRLNTTQPNISSRIASLEEALDVVLMERDAGSVRLTVKGQELLEYARKVLDLSEQFIEVAGKESLLQGVLRLGVTEMVVHTWLSDFLRMLKDQYPNVGVELTVDLSAQIDKDFDSRAIDLAFQSAPFNRRTEGELALGTFAMIWIASPDLGLHNRKKLGLGDLSQHPILTHARGTVPYREVFDHFNHHRDFSFRLTPSSNLAACIQMAVDGYGCAAVPKAMVLDELESGQLVEIKYHWTPASLHFFARYDSERSRGFVSAAAEIGQVVAREFISKHQLTNA